MDAQTFFTRFAELLPANPPAKEDVGRGREDQENGHRRRAAVCRGQARSANRRKASRTGRRQRSTQSSLAAKGSLGELRNGWIIHWDLGRYGTNYGLRAVIAWLGLGVERARGCDLADDATSTRAAIRSTAPTSTYCISTRVRRRRRKAFWSLAMYNDKQCLVANPIDRHAIGDRDKLKLQCRWLAGPLPAERGTGPGQGIELAAGAEGKLQRDPARLLAQAGNARRGTGRRRRSSASPGRSAAT